MNTENYTVFIGNGHRKDSATTVSILRSKTFICLQSPANWYSYIRHYVRARWLQFKTRNNWYSTTELFFLAREWPTVALQSAAVWVTASCYVAVRAASRTHQSAGQRLTTSLNPTSSPSPLFIISADVMTWLPTLHRTSYNVVRRPFKLIKPRRVLALPNSWRSNQVQ